MSHMSNNKSELILNALPVCTHAHTQSKLTPVSGCAVQANSVVAHVVSIRVSVEEREKKNGQTTKFNNFEFLHDDTIEICLQDR